MNVEHVLWSGLSSVCWWLTHFPGERSGSTGGGQFYLCMVVKISWLQVWHGAATCSQPRHTARFEVQSARFVRETFASQKTTKPVEAESQENKLSVFLRNSG